MAGRSPIPSALSSIPFLRCAAACEFRQAVWCASHSGDRKSTRLNSSHGYISYAVFCLKKKNSSVYFHKTVRIAEEMLARAVERSDAPIAEIQNMGDHGLLNWLMQQGPLQRQSALRLNH